MYGYFLEASHSAVEHFLFPVAGATVYVHGKGARPTLSQCIISDSENVGVFVTDGAQVRTLISMYIFSQCSPHISCGVGWENFLYIKTFCLWQSL